LQPGEGAFYGPKIEFSLKDCLDRVWQCGTIQVDFSMPDRLDAQYIAEDGSKQSPVMLHRAILGSLERFIGILIEEYAGKFPVWLAPTQVILMSITDKSDEYIALIAKNLQKQGIRVKIDLRNEKIGFKIREHTLKRIPYLVVVGEKEVNNNELAVRTLSGKDMGNFTPEDFITLLAKNIAERNKLEP
jgi:threonyl-tRNA synthetase